MNLGAPLDISDYLCKIFANRRVSEKQRAEGLKKGK